MPCFLTGYVYLKLDNSYRKLNGSFTELNCVVCESDANDGTVITIPRYQDIQTIDLMSIEFPTVNTVKLFAVIGILF